MFPLICPLNSCYKNFATGCFICGFQEDDKLKKLQMEVGESSKLALEVQKLIKMIFDVESMKKTMAEFEVFLQ